MPTRSPSPATLCAAISPTAANEVHTHPISNICILEARARYYDQGHATFYSDVFPFADSQNFIARDQDLAQSTNTTLGAKATYAFLPEGWKFFKRGTVTLDVSRVQFKYADFRNIRDASVTDVYPIGQTPLAPLYHFDAIIYQIYMSMFF